MKSVVEKYVHFVNTIKPRPTSGELQMLAWFAKYIESGDEADIPQGVKVVKK